MIIEHRYNDCIKKVYSDNDKQVKDKTTNKTAFFWIVNVSRRLDDFEEV